MDKQLRTKQFGNELRSLLKCSKIGLSVATVLWADVPNCRLYMRKLEGMTVKQWLRERETLFDSDECKMVAKELGCVIAKLHQEGGLVHGDLTTSNFMLDTSLRVWMLDFGLSYYSTDAEDFAVDLYVLERAMLSTHPKSEQLFVKILKAYRKAYNGQGQAVVSRLNNVRQRGRKKIAFG